VYTILNGILKSFDSPFKLRQTDYLNKEGGPLDYSSNFKIKFPNKEIFSEDVKVLGWHDGASMGSQPVLTFFTPYFNFYFL